jgi:hypothetical protein
MVENPATDSTPANSVTDVEREIICIWVRDSSKALAELQQSFEIARPDDTSPTHSTFRVQYRSSRRYRIRRYS